MKPKMSEGYIRSGVFGAEDALISTTGIAIGLLTTSVNREFVLLALFLAIFVAALSAGSSELISEETVQDINKTDLKDNPILSSLVMFISYLTAGLIPTIPILLFDSRISILGTIIFSIIGFFILGFIKGRFSHRSVTRSIIQVLLVGGLSALAGILVGFHFRV